jgi:hypothetical protein
MKELMIHVEKAVRPVRASGGRKDRMRRELLAHLTEIYQTELKRLGNEAAAHEQAIQRFGAPADLTRELQDSVGWGERCAFAMERWFGWRAPESAARYTFRMAVQLFLLISVLAALAFVPVLIFEGQAADMMIRLRLAFSFVFLCSADVFLLGLLYFKMRDRLLGGLGVQRSWRHVAVYGMLSILVFLANGFSFGFLGIGDAAEGWKLMAYGAPFALGVPLWMGLIARFHGPGQIRHTEWECLDIGVDA